MSSPLWASRVVVSPLKNVPGLGHDAAYLNAIACRLQQPDRLFATEAWPKYVKPEFAIAFGAHWLWHHPADQSAMLGCDTHVWTVMERGVLTGMASPRIPGVCDRRDVPWWELRHNETGRKVLDFAVHTTPLPTRKAPLKVPAARVAQSVAARRMTRYAASRNLASTWAGDFNRTATMTDPDLARRGADDERIIHAEFHHGANQRVSASAASSFSLPRSDHRGLLVIQKGWGK